MAAIQGDGDQLSVVEVLGTGTTITGGLVSADLTAGTVVVDAQ